ncbi:glycosyltransferase family 4 protein [Polynucleobacter paneuropaeus]|nr:glycosyltransferase family 4 protein [Polynucleobacter paneuropaeus]
MALISSIPKEWNAIIQIDSRLLVPNNISKNIIFRRVQPNLYARLRADYWIKKQSKKNDLIICFGSLPLFFGAKGRQIVFVQNLYLIEGKVLSGFSLKTMMRIRLERFWFNFAKDRVEDFAVQSQSMKIFLLNKIGQQKLNKVHILPFSGYSDKGPDRGNEPVLNVDSKQDKKKFIYVASGEPHKNHKSLVTAWRELSNYSFHPLLILTIDPIEFKQLCEWIDNEVKIYNLNIINLGSIPHDQVLVWYSKVDALLFPSLFESFGLPLIEASNIGLPIIASELDYVRDILDPMETFDPNSPTSIARSVGRFLKTTLNRPSILNPDQFIEKIIDVTRSRLI